jgi:uncharacterized protein
MLIEEPPPVDAAPEAPKGGAGFSALGTLLYSVLLLVFLAGLMFFSSRTRIESLERPEDDLERVVGREMDVRQALESAPEWDRRLELLFSGDADILSQSIRWYDELAREFDSPDVQLNRVILLAEAGRADRVIAAIVPWQFQGGALTRMRQWVQAAYLGELPDRGTGEKFLSEIREQLPPGWFPDTLVAHIAGSIGDRISQQAAESAIAHRGSLFLNRRRALLAFSILAVIIGSLIAVRLSMKPQAVRIGEAHIPPPWNFQDGYALFIRGVLGFLIISGLVTYFLPEKNPLNAVTTLLAGVPIFWWTGRYLAARGLTIPLIFGLQRPSNPGMLVKVTIVLAAVAVIGEIIIAVAIGALHIEPDWTDGFLEEMLWGPWWVLFGEALDSIVWAPVVEEVVFRGVLYGTLRRRMAVWPAALGSAAIFALVHGYGAIGLASVFWSGIIWALAYERTLSLWPGILAHGLNNLLVTVEFVWIFR